MSHQSTSKKTTYSIETPVLGGVGKAALTVDTQPERWGHRWDAQVVHPLVQVSRHGFSPSEERAELEAIAWLSAAAVALELAEGVLGKMIRGRKEPEAPSPRM
jgi:hypothetical protein